MKLENIFNALNLTSNGEYFIRQSSKPTSSTSSLAYFMEKPSRGVYKRIFPEDHHLCYDPSSGGINLNQKIHPRLKLQTHLSEYAFHIDIIKICRKSLLPEDEETIRKMPETRENWP